MPPLSESDNPTMSHNYTSTVAAAEDGFCSRLILPTDRPSDLEVILPPLVLMVLACVGLASLMIGGRFQARRKHCYLRMLQDSPPEELLRDFSVTSSNIDELLDGPEFYTDFDNEVICELKGAINRPRKLLRICIPAMTSMLLMAAIIIVYEPMVGCVWPGMPRPDINTAITCFLMPAGLVYALSFGFIFQQAMEKQGGILDQITNELSLMDQIVTLATKLKLPTNKHVMAICKAVKCEVILTAMLIQNRETPSFKNKPPPCLKLKIWSIIDILRDAVVHAQYGFNLNRVIANNVVTYILNLNNICTDRMGAMHTRIHALTWLFLEILGSMSLFGVMLIDASSRRMELTMCYVTMFSVSMLCYVLADLDSPFNGFFRVKVSVLNDVLRRTERIFTTAAQGGDNYNLSYGGQSDPSMQDCDHKKN